MEKIKKEETSEEFAETLEQSSRGSRSAKEKKRLKRTAMLTRVLHPDRLLLLVGKTFALFAIGKYEEARERVRAHFYRAGNERALPLRQRLAIFPVKTRVNIGDTDRLSVYVIDFQPGEIQARRLKASSKSTLRCHPRLLMDALFDPLRNSLHH